MELVSRKLVCHNNKFEWLEDGYTGLTVGKEYEIVEESNDCFTIVCDKGYEEDYTKEPDTDGHSYKNWFTLVEEYEEVDE